MKSIIVFALFLITCNFAYSANFECQTYHNLDVISAQIVKTELNVKTNVDSTDVAVSYLTEKNDAFYVLEVFLPYSEMRIYSEANVANAGQTITASAWSREYMVDVVCRKLN